MINSAICNILNNDNTDIDIQECFDEIFSGLCNPILSGVFLSLIKTRQSVFEDTLAGINSARSAVKKCNLNTDCNFLIENICLNQNPQYIDISFAVDVICAANDIGAVKAIVPNYSSNDSSFAILKELAIDTDNLTVENFEKTKFIYSYIPTESPYLKYTQDIYRALPYKTALNTINHFLNPYGAKNCTLALPDRTAVEKYAQLCLNLGYVNSVIFSSGDFSYISIEDETNISEAWKNKIFSYTVAPELLGIERNPVDTLKVENIAHSAEITQAVFENKLKDSFYDVIVINAGLALYITKKAKSLMEGIELARKTINDKKAYEQLSLLKNIPSD